MGGDCENKCVFGVHVEMLSSQESHIFEAPVENETTSTFLLERG